MSLRRAATTQCSCFEGGDRGIWWPIPGWMHDGQQSSVPVSRRGPGRPRRHDCADQARATLPIACATQFDWLRDHSAHKAIRKRPHRDDHRCTFHIAHHRALTPASRHTRFRNTPDRCSNRHSRHRVVRPDGIARAVAAHSDWSCRKWRSSRSPPSCRFHHWGDTRQVPIVPRRSVRHGPDRGASRAHSRDRPPRRRRLARP